MNSSPQLALVTPVHISIVNRRSSDRRRSEQAARNTIEKIYTRIRSADPRLVSDNDLLREVQSMLRQHFEGAGV